MTRYEEIAARFEKDFANNKYKVGDKLPTEEIMAKTYQVSRFTIRAAMDTLQQKGFISRRRRHGTIVTATKPKASFVQEMNSLDAFLQYDADTILMPVGKKKFITDHAMARFLDTSQGESWTHIETIRYKNGDTPVCWTDLYVPQDIAGIADKLGKSSTSVYRLIEETFNVRAKDINAEIFAGILDKRKSKALNVEDGSAAMIIIRRYVDEDGKLFEVSVSEHPAGLFTYSINLNRST